MNFRSILFRPDAADVEPPSKAPDFFGDLNLDQIVTNVACQREDYDLAGFFRLPVPDIAGVHYRHEVFRDLEDDSLHRQITTFAGQMRKMHEHLAEIEAARHGLVGQRWFLDAADIYYNAIVTLNQDLEASAPASEGLQAFRSYLSELVDSDYFSQLVEDTRQRQSDLADIRYCVLVDGLTVTVSRYKDEPDYSAQVADTFERFKQDAAGEHRQAFDESNHLNQVETRILGCVAELYPTVFEKLDGYCKTHQNYLDDSVARFEREIQFYMAYRAYMAGVEKTGPGFCYPELTDSDKTIHVNDGFDMALVHQLVREKEPIVTNDFYLEDPERLIVVSGPNQGGKTTFSRMFGQLHYLARLGCPVPGSEARLKFYDQIFTHYERAEDLQNLHGKLEDDLVRIHHVLSQATADSIVIMNEIFGSTTTSDALSLGEKVLRQLIDKDTLSVCVTFIDELASLDEHVVSMVSTVDPDDPAIRTFKVVRKPAEGLAYARALANKHQLTREALEARL